MWRIYYVDERFSLIGYVFLNYDLKNIVPIEYLSHRLIYNFMAIILSVTYKVEFANVGHWVLL